MQIIKSIFNLPIIGRHGI